MSITKYILCIIALLLLNESFYAQKGKEILSAKKLFKAPVYLVLKGKYSTGNIEERYGGIYKPRLLKSNKNANKVYRLRILLDYDRNGNPYPFPINPKDYPNVQEIIIGGNFNSFPNEIFEFENLQAIITYGLCSSDDCQPFLQFHFPDELFQLQHLKYLFIWVNGAIYYIPEKINQLKKIEYLFVRGSKFDFLPLSISKLPQLNRFWIDLYSNNNSESEIFKAELNYYLNQNRDFDTNLISKYDDLWWSDMAGLSSYIEQNDFNQKENSLKIKKNQNYSSNYKSGKKQVEGQLLDGKPDGKWTFYYENGKVKLERYYDKGIEVGMWGSYDTLGYKTKEYIFTPQEDKVVIRFYEEFKTDYNNEKKVYESITPYLGREITLIKGKAEGDWKWYIEPKTIADSLPIVKRIHHYTNDKLDKYIYTFKDARRVINSKDGIKHGSDISWINWNTEDQRKIHEAFYIDGVIDGRMITWYKSGMKKAESFFTKGVREYYKFWDESGNLKRKIIWSDNTCGKWAAGHDYYYENDKDIFSCGNSEETKWLANGIKQVTLRDEEKNETKITTYNKQGETIKEELYKDGKLVKTE